MNEHRTCGQLARGVSTAGNDPQTFPGLTSNPQATGSIPARVIDLRAMRVAGVYFPTRTKVRRR